MNTDPDYTFPYFLLAFVFLSEYQTTVGSVVSIHSGSHPWSSDGISGFTELTKHEGTKPLPRAGKTCFQMEPAQPSKSEGDGEIQFLTDLQRLLIYMKRT